MFGRSANRKKKSRQPRLPDIYVWHDQKVGGITLRFFIPRTEVDLVRELPTLEYLVTSQLDEAWYEVVGVRSYAAYVAVQWRWTPAVEHLQKINELLQDAEQRVVNLLGSSFGWDREPMVGHLTSAQGVRQAACERGMGDMWMLGGS